MKNKKKITNTSGSHDHLIQSEQFLLECWHDEYYRRLFNLGFKIIANKVLVKDSIQDLFLELWQKKHLIREIKSPWAYLKRTFIRILLQNKTQFRGSADISTAESQLSTPSYETRLIAWQTDKQLQRQLQTFLAQLPPKQKRMLEMKFGEGYSYEEIANITGKSRRTIYNQVFQAVRNLRKFGFGNF